jgi:ubiquinone biosynthesis accessory factor UbiJ
LNTVGAGIESLLNRVLALDPDAVRRLASLHGRVLLLELTESDATQGRAKYTRGEDPGRNAPIRFYVLPRADGVRVAREYDGVPDVTIAGTAAVFMRQLLRGPTVSGELTIRGDIELGQRFQRIVASFRPDWEEGVARVAGDIPARQLGRMAARLREWGRHAARTLSEDTADYLKEEAMILAKRQRVENFMRAVDTLRTDVDRLEKRAQRLGALRR